MNLPHLKELPLLFPEVIVPPGRVDLRFARMQRSLARDEDRDECIHPVSEEVPGQTLRDLGHHRTSAGGAQRTRTLLQNAEVYVFSLPPFVSATAAATCLYIGVFVPQANPAGSVNSDQQ